jgi:hypothetical protein
MELRGSERHRWANRKVDMAGAHESTYAAMSFNGETGVSDMAGEAAR